MIKGKNEYLTTAEAAKELEVCHDYVRKFIYEGKLVGERVGRNWVVKKSSMEKLRKQRTAKKEKRKKPKENYQWK